MEGGRSIVIENKALRIIFERQTNKSMLQKTEQ
jgi:hypothetical protein